MSAAAPSTTRLGTFAEEARKIPAFFRRDFLVMWSYRFGIVGDWFNLVVQVVVFFFVGRLVAPGRLPRFGGVEPSYMEFVAVGIALTAFLQIGITRVVAVIRQEQFMGTLEPLLAAPLAAATLQLGSVIYDLLYVPLRSLVFLGVASVLFDVRFELSGLLPAGAILIVFIPFVWGVGMVGSAAVLTFKRGGGAVSFGGVILSIASGTYFPVRLLPEWAAALARYNPIAMALNGTREALIGDAGWALIWPDVVALVPASAVALVAGLVAFHLALNRERRQGSLGMY